MSTDTVLLRAAHVLPIRPEKTWLKDHAVRIVDGVIDDILPDAEALVQYPDDPQMRLDRHILMPGLINAHTHSAMTLLRGYADDLPLDRWLREHIWPAEQRWLSTQYVEDGTRLALAEMIRAGTTCMNEMYFFPEVIAETVDSAGFRAMLGAPIIDVPTPWAAGIDEGLGKARNLAGALAGHDRLTVALAPHAPYTVDDDGLAGVAELAADTGVRVNMHVLEAASERAGSMAQYGKDPLVRLQDHKLLGPEFMAVHMVHLTEQDIERLALTGAHVIHCPESNMKLGNGVCPTTDLIAAGVNVAIGTDGAASNNDLDLFSESRTAAFLAKGSTGNAQALDAWQALDMMTIGGARALGQESRLGSIEVGKAADLCAVNVDCPEMQPLHNAASQLVYTAASRQVSHVWVAGRPLLNDGELLSLDLERILATARDWHARMGAP